VTPAHPSQEDREDLVRRLTALLPAIRNRFRRSIPAEARVQFHESMGHVTATQLEALSLLRDAPDGMTMHELALAQGGTPSSASQLVERLVRLEMVERIRTDEDRRVVRVALTDASRTRFESMLQMHNSLFAEMTASLDDKELSTLIELLAKLASAQEA
jgi:DNA-binding MarR family transcriptional regulator